MNLSWKNTLGILVIIVILGTALRMYDLGNNSFIADEFLDMNSSYGYFQTGEWRAWDFNFGKAAEMNVNAPRDERAFVYKWQVASLFHILPPTEATARLVSVGWGIFSILVLFWTGYVFTRKKTVGLLAAFLFAVSISGIIFNRRLRMYAMFFPLYLASATFAFLALEQAYEGRMRWCRFLWDKFGIHVYSAMAAAAFFILSLLTHQLTAVLVFSFASYLLIRSVQTYRTSKSLKNRYVVLLGLGMLSLFLLSFVAPQTVRSFTAGLIWLDDHYSYLGYITRDFAHPLIGVLIAGFGSYILGKNLGKPKEALYLTLSAVVPLVLAIWFFRRNAGPQYIFFAQSFVLLLGAVGTYGVARIFTETFPIYGRKGMVTIFLLAGLLLPNWGYFLEENNTYHETSSGGNPNYRKVFDYFKKNKQDSDALITRNLRNYYWSGAKVPVIDLGDEINREKFTLPDLEKVMSEHPSGWIILSENDYDYFSGEAEDFMKRNLIRVSNPSVRGPIDVYRWE